MQPIPYWPILAGIAFALSVPGVRAEEKDNHSMDDIMARLRKASATIAAPDKKQPSSKGEGESDGARKKREKEEKDLKKKAKEERKRREKALKEAEKRAKEERKLREKEGKALSFFSRDRTLRLGI